MITKTTTFDDAGNGYPTPDDPCYEYKIKFEGTLTLRLFQDASKEDADASFLEFMDNLLLTSDWVRGDYMQSLGELPWETKQSLRAEEEISQS